MWTIIHSKRFAKDLVRMQRRGKNPVDAFIVIERLRLHGQAEVRCRPHKLTGEWASYWECHIGFDWLLIYTVDAKEITLWRTGTHDDLFG